MNFGNFFESRLCVMCVETLTGVLFWSSDLLGKPFRASCFPFETLSGSLLLSVVDLLAFCEFSFGADIIGCLHAASLQPHRASLTPLGRVRVPLVFVRVISGIPSLSFPEIRSAFLFPRVFVARRVALFWNLHFFGVFITFLFAFLAFSLQQAALSSI